jgi:hypothetical protein
MKHCVLLETETRNKLKELGTKSETYDQIINRILLQLQNHSKSGDFISK